MRTVHLLVAVYVVGVAIGLWRVDGGPMTKLVLAVLWPIGPLAGAVVISGLLLVSLVAFPRFGVAVGAAALVAWLLL
jgi:hypothetical protein